MDPSPTHPRPIGLELINFCFIFTRPKPLSYMRAVSLKMSRCSCWTSATCRWVHNPRKP